MTDGTWRIWPGEGEAGAEVFDGGLDSLAMWCQMLPSSDWLLVFLWVTYQWVDGAGDHRQQIKSGVVSLSGGKDVQQIRWHRFAQFVLSAVRLGLGGLSFIAGEFLSLAMLGLLGDLRGILHIYFS